MQQHTIYVTPANGFVGQMDVCFVGYVRDGMISRAYEYFDTGQIEKFIGPPELTMAAEHGRPPADGLVERVRALVPMIAATSFEAEAQRRPLDEVIDALEGDRRVPLVRRRAIRRLRDRHADVRRHRRSPSPQADPSMGWITTFYMEHNWLLTMFADGAPGRDLRLAALRARPRAA